MGLGPGAVFASRYVKAETDAHLLEIANGVPNVRECAAQHGVGVGSAVRPDPLRYFDRAVGSSSFDPLDG